jgi:hypothetical protein
VLPRGIAAVVMLKVVDVPEMEEANVVGEARFELVDQTGVYVTEVPMADPSVYVVTAFHESVSACATDEQTTMISAKAINGMLCVAFIEASVSGRCIR